MSSIPPLPSFHARYTALAGTDTSSYEYRELNLPLHEPRTRRTPPLAPEELPSSRAFVLPPSSSLVSPIDECVVQNVGAMNVQCQTCKQPFLSTVNQAQ